MNLFYELYTASAVSVAKRSSDSDEDGNLIYGRNLEIHPSVPEDLNSRIGLNVSRSLTINVNFRKNGEILYRGASLVGQIYPSEGMRPGKFSCSQNSGEIPPETALRIVIEWAKGERAGLI